MAIILENNTEQYELECQALPTSDSIKLSLDITYESKDSNTVEVTEIANLTTSGREYSSRSNTELTPINTIATDESGKYTEDMSALFGSAFSSSINLSPTNQVAVEEIIVRHLPNYDLSHKNIVLADEGMYFSCLFKGSDNNNYAKKQSDFYQDASPLYIYTCEPEGSENCVWELVEDTPTIHYKMVWWT